MPPAAGGLSPRTPDMGERSVGQAGEAMGGGRLAPNSPAKRAVLGAIKASRPKQPFSRS